jgi:hypothetical protein
MLARTKVDLGRNKFQSLATAPRHFWHRVMLRTAG